MYDFMRPTLCEIFAIFTYNEQRAQQIVPLS